jgi:hypothetical protein
MIKINLIILILLSISLLEVHSKEKIIAKDTDVLNLNSIDSNNNFFIEFD